MGIYRRAPVRASALLSRLQSSILILLACLGPALLPMPAPAASQKPDLRKDYALIFGTVWGPDDRPVYGVKVKIRRASDKRAKWELMSDHQGEFALRVPVGKADYVVWVDAKDLKGFKLSDGRQLQPDTEVTVQITYNERQDIGLHLK
jgi:hypothetical protein